MNFIGNPAGGKFSGVNYFQKGRHENRNGRSEKNHKGKPTKGAINGQERNNTTNFNRNKRRGNRQNGRDRPFGNRGVKHDDNTDGIVHFEKSTSTGGQDKKSEHSGQNGHAISRGSKAEPVSGNQRSTEPFSSKFVGAMVENPQDLGFRKVSRGSLAVPKYMLKTQTLFESSPFVQNEWDRKNQEMLAARESEFQGDPQVLFQEFQGYRKKEREQMEKLNLVDQENAKKSLDAAISFRGSCQDMCPTFERVEREFKNQVSRWEKDPSTGRISKMFAIKTFMRPSGQPPSLPSDVRPPKVLSRTLNYIIDNLLDKLPDSQSFIWDRTRSIRQDFTFQNNYSGIESIDCHERICRIHILSLHVMAAAHDPDYQQQQEIEQFNNSLQTLTHMYDDVRSRGGICPNEAEFRSYELISKIDDTELDRNLQRLPDTIISAPVLQRAIFLRGLILRGVGRLDLYSAFFRAIFDGHTPFLLACLAEIHFNMIRYNALSMLARSLHSKAKNMPDAKALSADLGFDTVGEFLQSCKLYALPILTGPSREPQVEVTALKAAFKRHQAQPYTKRIDTIPHPATYKDIVNGGMPNYALNLRAAHSLEEVARWSFHEGKRATRVVNEILEGNFQLLAAKMTEMQAGESAPVHRSHTSLHQLPSLLPQSAPASSTISSAVNGAESKPLFGATKTQPQGFTFGSPKAQTPLNKEIPKFRFSASGFSDTGSEAPHTIFAANNNAKPAFTFGQNLNKNENTLTGSNVQNAEDKSTVSNSLTKPAEIEQKVNVKHKLLENKLFDVSCRSLVDTMTHKIVSETTHEFSEEAFKVVKEAAKAKEVRRDTLVEELSSELYEAFIREQIYLAVLKSSADTFRAKMAKSFSIKCIMKAVEHASSKYKQRRKKIDEIRQFKQRLVPDVPHFIAKKPMLKATRSPYLPKDNSGSIDIESLLAKCCKEDGKLKMLFIWRDCEDTASKWLIGKMGLEKSSDGENIFKGFKSVSGTSLQMESLSDSFTPKRDFKDIDFVIIQIGTIDQDRNNNCKLIDKLLVDSKVLAKVMSYLSRFNKRHFTSILLTFFSFQSNENMDDRVAAYLKLDSYNGKSANVNVKLVNLSQIYKFQYRQMKENLEAGLVDMMKQEHEQKAKRESASAMQSTASMNTTTESNVGTSLVNLVRPTTHTHKFDERKVAYVKSQLSQTGKKMFKVRFKRRKLQNEAYQSTDYDLTDDQSNSSSSISLLSNTSVPISTGHFKLQTDKEAASEKTRSIIEELNKLSDEVLKD
ncbi:DEBR0S2_19548g1_1 [Brettanomyces bruxellensis]|uniref:Nuclear mRNA export factor n=1 Tax=Dekkera bruxellensis TaxID=5007 RepID=A0A7D9CX92_DEKBR|nr:DEBR0S2_19548g1_1 [Brettanomyces bruxellensis]